jgi:cytochrome P450
MADPCDECHLRPANDGMLRHVPAPVIRHLPITVVLSLLGIAFVAGTTYLQAEDAAVVNKRQDLAIHEAEKTQVRIETTVGIIREEQKEVQRDIKSILFELKKQNGQKLDE